MIREWENVADVIRLFCEIVKGQNENRLAYISHFRCLWLTLIDQEQDNGLI